MNNNQTLEMQIKANANEAISKIDTLITKITKLDKTTTSVTKTTNAEGRAIRQTIKETTKEADKLKTVITKIDKDGNIKNITTQVKQLNTGFSNLSKALSVSGLIYGISKLGKTMVSFMDSSVDYSEQLNMFNVVFKNVKKNGIQTYSELGQAAIKYQNKLNENFGTSMTETLKYQALFQSMGESAGISDKYAAIMSETMTNLTYDLASLYNKQEGDTAEALRAGVYAAQTKPLRTYGIDVTESTLEPLLQSLGITDRSIAQMSYAEKEILRYIATLKQAKNAMGDYANTIESPANQMKVFTNMVQEAKVAVSSLFMGLFQKILPYANAILMVIESIAQAIADLFGIKLSDYNTGTASVETGYEDLTDSIDAATDATNKLKRATLGFDQIHNINEDNGSGSGGNVSGGIDQRLLDAIQGYNNGLDGARMKAAEIRDRIMEWLGFTKEVDDITGKVTWKLKEGFTNIKLIGGVIAGLVGLKIVSSITKLISKIGTLITKNKALGTALTFVKSNFLRISTVVGGLVSVIAGSQGLTSAYKNMTVATDGFTKSSDEVNKSIGKTVLSIGELVAGGALIGSTFGPLGTAIGALGGAIIGVVSAITGYNQGIKELAKNDLFGKINISTEQWSNMLNSTEYELRENTTQIQAYKDEIKSLGSTFESSMDELDAYNFKFGALGQSISEEDGPKITSAIQSIFDSANSIIDDSTNLGLELFANTWKMADGTISEEGKNILNSMTKHGEEQKTTLKEAQNNITATYQNAIETRGYLTDEEYNYIQTQLAKIKELTVNEMTATQADVEFLKTKFADKNLSLSESSYDNFNEALKNYEKEQLDIIETAYTDKAIKLKNMLKNEEISYEEFNSSMNAIYNQRLSSEDEVASTIKKYTDDVTKSIKDKYKELLNDNSAQAKAEKKIIEGILDKETINNLKKNYGKAGETSAKKFNDGVDNILQGIPQKTLSIKVTADMTSFNNSMNSISNGSYSTQSYSVVKRALGGIFGSRGWESIPQYANGGIPSHGTMFAAGENGAEIVGNINRRTEVLNRSQIATAIYTAVSDAMSNFSGGNSQIDVVVHSDEGVIVDRINQRTKQTGICPINIPI